MPSAIDLHRLPGSEAVRRHRTENFARQPQTAVMMAAENQGYPKTSIEDDFNYGSNVASASVHIRMGK